MLCCIATATAVIAGGIVATRRRRRASQGGAPRTPVVQRSNTPERDDRADDRVNDAAKARVVRGLLP